MIIVVVSDDYWGARAEALVQGVKDVLVAVDRSGGLWRSLKLVLRGSVPLMAAVSILRASRSLPVGKPRSPHAFRSNAELRRLIGAHRASRTVLFRAGLIISGKTLEATAVDNIHCADIEGFGGLAALYRALKAGAHRQCATLHRVTDRIDEGEVLDREPFLLDGSQSYARNEAIAYEAGLQILARTVVQSKEDADVIE